MEHCCFSCLLVSLLREYVSSKTINKVVQVHDRIFCCMSGSLADAQAVTKAAKFQLSFHRCTTDSSAGQCSVTFRLLQSFSVYLSIQMESPPLVVSAASVLKDLCFKNREELQAGFITAGWDCKNGPQVRSRGHTHSHTEGTGPAHCRGLVVLLQVYVVALGGMLLRQPVTIGGSGSTYIYGYVDAKYRANMSREECLQFATNGIHLFVTQKKLKIRKHLTQ